MESVERWMMVVKPRAAFIVVDSVLKLFRLTIIPPPSLRGKADLRLF